MTQLESKDGQLLRELASLENMAALMERLRSLQVSDGKILLVLLHCTNIVRLLCRNCEIKSKLRGI